MIADLITEKTFLNDVVCDSWEELVDIAGGLLVKNGSVLPEFLESIKETIERYGAYMVLVEDVAFFHGRPDAGVNEVSMSLALLSKPVYLMDKRIKAAFVFAAVDNEGHTNLLRELAEALQNETFLSMLRSGATLEQLMENIQGAG